MKIILSSNNTKKIKEIQEILGCEVLNYQAFLDKIDVLEEGASFRENAFLKAREVAKRLELQEDFLVIADDSGLCVEALGGMPSIFSARFASLQGGVDEIMKHSFKMDMFPCSDELNNLKLLQCLDELAIQSSHAKFVCVIAVVGMIGGEKIEESFDGELEGEVGHHPLDREAFGYDALFIPQGYNITLNHLPNKNNFSHRFIAMNKFKQYLKNLS